MFLSNGSKRFDQTLRIIQKIIVNTNQHYARCRDLIIQIFNCGSPSEPQIPGNKLYSLNKLYRFTQFQFEVRLLNFTLGNHIQLIYNTPDHSELLYDIIPVHYGTDIVVYSRNYLTGRQCRQIDLLTYITREKTPEIHEY